MCGSDFEENAVVDTYELETTNECEEFMTEIAGKQVLVVERQLSRVTPVTGIELDIDDTSRFNIRIRIVAGDDSEYFLGYPTNDGEPRELIPVPEGVSEDTLNALTYRPPGGPVNTFSGKMNEVESIIFGVDDPTSPETYAAKAIKIFFYRNSKLCNRMTPFTLRVKACEEPGTTTLPPTTTPQTYEICEEDMATNPTVATRDDLNEEACDVEMQEEAENPDKQRWPVTFTADEETGLTGVKLTHHFVNGRIKAMKLRVRFYSDYFGVYELQDAEEGVLNQMVPIEETGDEVDELGYATANGLKTWTTAGTNGNEYTLVFSELSNGTQVLYSAREITVIFYRDNTLCSIIKFDAEVKACGELVTTTEATSGTGTTGELTTGPIVTEETEPTIASTTSAPETEETTILGSTVEPTPSTSTEHSIATTPGPTPSTTEEVTIESTSGETEFTTTKVTTTAAPHVCDGLMEELQCGELKTIVTDYKCNMQDLDAPDSSEECQIQCLKDMTTHVCVGTPADDAEDCRPICKDDPDMNFNAEANKCGKTCHTFHQKEFCIEPEVPMPGCVCKKGMVYDEVVGKCVEPEECSCLMDPVDLDNNGVFEFARNVTNGEQKYFEECYTESGEKFACTAECTGEEIIVKHDCYCSYNGIQYEEGDLIPNYPGTDECKKAYCANKEGVIEIVDNSNGVTEDTCKEMGENYTLSYEDGVCYPKCVKTDACRERYNQESLEFTWNKSGSEECVCESRGEVSYTVCGGTCGPSGFMIELGENGQLTAGLTSTCKCCTPMNVEYEQVTFDCSCGGAVEVVEFPVPTKQSQCTCNACADSGENAA